MKKFLIVAAAFLMLSFGCHQNTESSPPCRLSASSKQHSTGDDSTLVWLKVRRIIDGDTFEGHLTENGNPGVNPWAYELTKVVIRINGIDAPERGQFYGDVATLHLYSLIGEKTVGLKLKQKDIYGRWIATVYLDGTDIAEELLSQGLACHFKEHDSNPRYAQLENEARWNGLGLWCDDRPVAPWRWRKMSKEERDNYR